MYSAPVGIASHPRTFGTGSFPIWKMKRSVELLVGPTFTHSLTASLPQCVFGCAFQEIELRAGGGLCVSIGEMCHMLLTRQDWFGTMFPRLPVNVQKTIEEKLKEVKKQKRYKMPCFLCRCNITLCMW